ncbi:glycosidase [Paenibacillus sp. FSL R7-0297]|uniref:glycoside hydrolase family 130 protein n=1 Tax=Paenibacillus sp. FSL R7-0297 TaxID=2921680 RepID=UPI0030FC36B6
MGRLPWIFNPVLDAARVPYSAALVFNAGVAKLGGRYVMVFRNDYGSLEKQTLEPSHTTDLSIAFSDDGIHWTAGPKPVFKLRDESFEILSLSTSDLRNMVLFPERIHGNYVRLERPFTVYSRGGRDPFDAWISESPDLIYWGRSELLLAVEQVPFANDKIGPAAPPVKTDMGWLTTFHAVDIDPARGKNGWEPSWKKRYTAGIMLLDLDNPKKILGMSASPLLAPEAPYEMEGGFRNDVIFPGGMVLEKDGEVEIYYGAADTVVCLATAHVDDLIKLCLGE